MKQQTLSQYLRARSKEICAENKCTSEQHNCESYAYIRWDMQLLDVCGSDYFQGCSKPYAAIVLPWSGNMKELTEEVKDVCYPDIQAEGEQAWRTGLLLDECPYPERSWARKIWKDTWREFDKKNKLT